MNNKYRIKLFNHNTNVSFRGIDDIPYYYELTLVLEGKFIYELDGKRYTVSAGDAIFVREGQHRRRLPCEDNVNYYSINFYCVVDEIPNLPTFLKGCTTSEIKRILQLMEITNKDRVNQMRLHILYYYLCILIMQLQNTLTKNSMSPHINTMIKYISEHITEKIGLADVAASVNFSVSYCCYLFKKEMNTTIYDVILREKIYLAQEYILKGGMTLKEIGNMCGFCDYSHFLKSFKKVTGMLPSEYK